jgi:hypothetical protein
VIRDAVLHLNNEQPLLADLFEAPNPGDVGLRCTNLRTMNGKRPVFVDDSSSIFFFPYIIMRFVEIPAASLATGDPSLALATAGRADGSDGLPGSGAADGVGVTTDDADGDSDLEIDEDFLRRIREV